VASILRGFYVGSAKYNLLRRKVTFEYPTQVRFHCTKCGICCGDTKEKTRQIILLRPEAEQISKTTLQPISRFAFKIKGKTPYSYKMKKRENGKCVFLKKDCCTVYSSRPLVCRFYPFELRVSNGKKPTFLYTEECIGINQGQLLNRDHFRKMFRQARAKFKQSAAIDREELI
jgi:Fe-S-cluster containining protein